MVRPERFERPTYWFVARFSRISQALPYLLLTTRPELIRLLICIETAYISEALAGANSTTRDFGLSFDRASAVPLRSPSWHTLDESCSPFPGPFTIWELFPTQRRAARNPPPEGLPPSPMQQDSHIRFTSLPPASAVMAQFGEGQTHSRSGTGSPGSLDTRAKA